MNPSLALCNTWGPEHDRLTDERELAHWFVAVGLAEQPPVVTAADLAAARGLRSGLRAALSARDAPMLAAIAADWLEGASGCLCVDCETLEPRFTPDQTNPRCLMVPAVIDALKLAREQPERVRACANPACAALFLDTTRNRSRRWCSMELCGARAKASTYYRRHRAGEGCDGD